MTYCPECGSAMDGHADDTQTLGRDAVKIAQINAERDIKLARIAAKMNDEDQEVQLAVAETQAAVLAAEVQEGAVTGTPDEEPPAAPVVVVDSTPEQHEHEDTAPAPEPADEGSGPAAPPEHSESRGGNRGWFG
jgi:hypothetical protein